MTERNTARAVAPPVCTAYTLACSLGMTAPEVLAALRQGQSRLGDPGLQLPFEARCGVLPAAMDPVALAVGDDCRQSRLAAHLAAQLSRPIAAAVDRWGADRVAVVVGTSTGGLRETEAVFGPCATGGQSAESFRLGRTHAMGLTAGIVAERCGLTGPRHVVSTACSSGAKALAAARRMIACGLADAVVAGGLDTLCQLTLRGFHGLGILSLTGCRPFARDRDGIGLGEGGALMLLEREGEGPARLIGVGESCDAHQMSAPQPEGRGAEAAMREAIDQGGIGAGDIALINAHGTGTVLNDASEASAIDRVFGDRVPVLSTKGSMGHLLGAAGAVEAALCVAALQQGWAPASHGCDPIDETLPVRVQRTVSELTGRHVLSNSLAFGGSNASVLWEGTS